jgi:hypothetical protein
LPISVGVLNSGIGASQIFQDAEDYLFAILHHAERGIASIAENPSNLSGIVAMIHDRAIGTLFGFEVDITRRTMAICGGNHCLVSINGNAVLGFQRPVLLGALVLSPSLIFT